jgi:glucose dehydrogenase
MHRRHSRRLLCVALTLGGVVILIAAGWSRHSTPARASEFVAPAVDARVLASVRRGAGAAPRTDWSSNGSAGGTHYSTLDEISRANVDSLRIAWVFRTGDASDGVADSSGPATAFEATPLMLDGTVYIATPSARVIAVDRDLSAAQGDGTTQDRARNGTARAHTVRGARCALSFSCWSAHTPDLPITPSFHTYESLRPSHIADHAARGAHALP